MNLLFFLKCYLRRNLLPDKTKILKNTFVSLITTPARINNIRPTINSILLQTQLPEKIYIWISAHYKRFPEMTIRKIPKFLKHPLIQVEFVQDDLGPATKIIHFLKKYYNQPMLRLL